MNYLKRTAALLLACSMMVPAFACGKSSETSKQESGSESSQAENNSKPEESNSKGESSNADSGSSDEPDAQELLGFDEEHMVTDQKGGQNFVLNFNDNIAGQNGEDAANAIVTTLRGDDGKIYVPKTDINGTTVTKDGGEIVTEAYTGTTLASAYAEPTYKPAFRNYLAMWLDISQRENYVFDGDLLEYEMEIAEDAPDGVYPIEFTLVDIGDYEGKGVGTVDTNAGFVCINMDEPKQEINLGSNMTLTAETVSAKPGDTTKLKVKIDNNSGIVAFRLMIRYDSNVISIKKAGAGADLASRARLTARTIDEES